MPLSKDELPFPKVFSAEYYDRYGRTPLEKSNKQIRRDDPGTSDASYHLCRR